MKKILTNKKRLLYFAAGLGTLGIAGAAIGTAFPLATDRSAGSNAVFSSAGSKSVVDVSSAPSFVSDYGKLLDPLKISSTLSSGAFKALAFSGYADLSLMASKFGMMIPDIPAGTSLYVEKTAGKNSMIFWVGYSDGYQTNYVAFPFNAYYFIDYGKNHGNSFEGTLLNYFDTVTDPSSSTTLTQGEFSRLGNISVSGLDEIKRVFKWALPVLPEFYEASAFKSAGSDTLALSIRDPWLEVTTLNVKPQMFSGDKPYFDSIVSYFKSPLTTSLSKVTFSNRRFANADLWTFLNAAGLIDTPQIDSYLSASVNKQAGQLKVSMTLSMSGYSETFSFEPATYTKSAQEIAIENYVGQLATLTTTSLTKSAFLNFALSSNAANGTFQEQLARIGVVFPPVPSGMTLYVSKYAGLPYILYSLFSGGDTASGRVTPTVFANSPEEQRSLDEYIAALSSITASKVSPEQFAGLQVVGPVSVLALNAWLGLVLPPLPEGFTLSVSKPYDHTDITYTIGLNGESRSKTVQILSFGNSKEQSKQLRDYGAQVASIVKSSLSQDDFLATSTNGAASAADNAKLLGIAIPAAPQGMVVDKVSKSAASDTISFTIRLNSETITITAKISQFNNSAAQSNALREYASKLASIRATTRPIDDFSSFTLSDVLAPATAAAILGISLPTGLPDGAVIKVQKLYWGQLLNFSVSLNNESVTSLAYVQSFGNTEYQSQQLTSYAQLLGTIKQSSLDQAAFVALRVNPYDSSAGNAAALGLTIPDAPAGITVKYVGKNSGTNAVDFTVSLNNETRQARASISQFGNSPEQSQALAEYADRLAAISASSLTRSEFYALSVPSETSLDKAAFLLGLGIPAAPTGVTLAVTKSSQSNIVNFVVALNKETRSISLTVASFANSPEESAELRSYADQLAAIDASSLTRSDFYYKVQGASGTAEAAAAALGLVLPAVPASITVSLTKNSVGSTVDFTVFLNGETVTGKATIKTFPNTSTDQQTLNSYLAQLGAINTSSLTSEAYAALSADSQEDIAAAAARLGLTPPTAPAGARVSLSKSAFGSLQFTVTYVEETKSINANVTNFASNADDVTLDSYAQSLGAVTKTSLTESAFVAASAQQAASLGLSLPAVPAGVVLSLSKNADSKTVNYVLTLNGRTRLLAVTFNNFQKPTITELDSYLKALSSVYSSNKPRYAYLALAINGTISSSELANTLGISLPEAPDGLRLSAVKTAGSSEVGLTLTLNGATTNASLNPYVFNGENTMEQLGARLSLLKVTSLPYSSYLQVSLNGYLTAADVSQTLGIALPAFPDRSLIYLQKSAGSRDLSVTYQINGMWGSGLVNITKSSTDDAAVSGLQSFTEQLQNITATSLSKNAFDALELAKSVTPLQLFTVLRITPVALPTGVEIYVTKNRGTEVTITLTLVGQSRSALLRLTSFNG